MQATTSDYMLPALVVVFALSFVPSEEWFLLGNRGAAVNAVLAPVILTTSWGCVWILNKLLAGLLHVAGMVGAHQNQGYVYLIRFNVGLISIRQETRTGIRSLVHILAVVALTSLLVPYQVVFVACFLLQLWTCASSKTADGAAPERDSHNQRASILLLLFALLPSMAPSLAVWVRTVATTKSIALFGSDHSAVPILPVLFLVESSSSGIEPLFSKSATRYAAVLLLRTSLANAYA
jgi:GPI inositol-deacylase